MGGKEKGRKKASAWGGPVAGLQCGSHIAFVFILLLALSRGDGDLAANSTTTRRFASGPGICVRPMPASGHPLKVDSRYQVAAPSDPLIQSADVFQIPCYQVDPPSS